MSSFIALFGWFVANVAGLGLGMAVFHELLGPAVKVYGRDFGWHASAAIGGALSGTMQIIMLRGAVAAWAGWIAATSAGWALGCYLGFSHWATGALFGLAVGVLQALVLWRCPRNQLLWIVASVVGWAVTGAFVSELQVARLGSSEGWDQLLAAALVSSVPNGGVLPVADPSQRPRWRVPLPLIVAAAGVGGAVCGIALLPVLGGWLGFPSFVSGSSGHMMMLAGARETIVPKALRISCAVFGAGAALCALGGALRTGHPSRRALLAACCAPPIVVAGVLIFGRVE